MNRTVLSVGLILTVPLLGVLYANLGRDPHAVESPLIGRPAPAFTLVSLEGVPVSLSSLRGKPVVLNFWASWCGPCVVEHPALVEGARALQGKVHFVGVVYEDEPDNARAFLSARGGGYPSLLDPGGRTAIAYGATGVPETFFLDAGGTVRAKKVGPLDPEELATRIRSATP